MTLTIYARDENNEKLGEIDIARTSGMAFVLRYNDAGTWTFGLAADGGQAALFTRRSGIYVTYNNFAIFSGYITGFEQQVTPEGDEILTLYGRDDLGLLSTRLALPDPSGPPYTAQEYDTRAGVAESVIKEYIRYNAADLAQPARKIQGLTVEEDYARGGAVVGRARFDVLLDLAQSLAAIGGIGIKCVDMRFECFDPVDRSADIVLSKETGTLLGYTFEESAPDSSYIICGGLGDGTARAFVETQNAEAVLSWGRAERFLDYSRTSVLSELLDQARAELGRVSDTAKLTVSVPPDEAEGRRLLVDYSLGDLVSVVVGDDVIKMRLVEVEIKTDDSGGVKMTPIFAVGHLPIGLINPSIKERMIRLGLGRLERR